MSVTGGPQNPAACTLRAGDLDAVFLPAQGMLGASLPHQGVELLRRVEDLQAAAAKGSTADIPLLHPWANRLDGLRYRVAGREVRLDPSSSLLHLDAHGLPMHGVPWSRLAWEVTEVKRDFLAARLDWARSDLLAVFPFRHRLEMDVTLQADGLTVETTLVAGRDDAVPVSFGFHPYIGIPDLPRAQWRLRLPAMRKLVLDNHGIPTREEEPFAAFDAQLGKINLDDGFVVPVEHATLAVVGAGRRITVEVLEGYRYATSLCTGRPGVRCSGTYDRADKRPDQRTRVEAGQARRRLSCGVPDASGSRLVECSEG